MNSLQLYQCLAHCINFSLQQVTHTLKSIKEGLNFSMDMIKLIKLSPKENVKKQQVSNSASKISLCVLRDGQPELEPFKL